MTIATIVANLIGGCIFFWVDRWIFGDKKVRSKKKVAAGAEELARAEVVASKDEVVWVK